MFAAGVAAGGAVAVLGVAIAAVALLFTGHAPVQTPNLVGPARGAPSPRDSVPLAVHLAVRDDHSYHVAIGLTHHEFAHS